MSDSLLIVTLVLGTGALMKGWFKSQSTFLCSNLFRRSASKTTWHDPQSLVCVFSKVSKAMNKRWALACYPIVRVTWSCDQNTGLSLALGGQCDQNTGFSLDLRGQCDHNTGFSLDLRGGDAAKRLPFKLCIEYILKCTLEELSF